jgi:hypothetical protein
MNELALRLDNNLGLTFPICVLCFRNWDCQSQNNLIAVLSFFVSGITELNAGS